MYKPPATPLAPNSDLALRPHDRTHTRIGNVLEISTVAAQVGYGWHQSCHNRLFSFRTKTERLQLMQRSRTQEKRMTPLLLHGQSHLTGKADGEISGKWADCTTVTVVICIRSITPNSRLWESGSNANLIFAGETIAKSCTNARLNPLFHHSCVYK